MVNTLHTKLRELFRQLVFVKKFCFRVVRKLEISEMKK